MSNPNIDSEEDVRNDDVRNDDARNDDLRDDEGDGGESSLALPPLPLDFWHRARGARMVPFAGYEMPVQYEGILAEHWWTRQHAGLFDVSHMGQLHLSGDGLDAALEAILPIDLATLKPGMVRYSLLLNDQGGILDDLMVTRWESGLYLVVNSATKWDDIAHLREHLPDEITLAHRDESALLALQGPEAAAVLERLTQGAKPIATLSFMRGAFYHMAGIEVWISRSGYTGEDGFEISAPAQSAAMLADLLCAQSGVMPIGLGARDSLRLEAGLPLYGHDLSEETDPVSAGLGFALSKRRCLEGGFPGAERLQKLLTQGTPRVRVGLVLDGRQAAREGADVLADGAKIGVVTSGGFSPTLGCAIAMAYIDSQYASPEMPFVLDVRGKKLTARVTPLPFVPHHYHRAV